MALEMKRVFSSHVLSIGYDDETQELHVHYAPTVKNPAGAVHAYAGVDPETAESVITSPSIGSALHAMIRGKFDHRQVRRADRAD